ncbi:TetR/AcrR family transcriptional regulator [Actinomadura darangshiensis]|uniref:TetR/AcrR family transcriptional regulator n=1 Tax=Actinomadura darangshiensis TaxID=705336 RepID=A0A4R5BP89_9ACTN|nr:TetR/AcrR family transcriptional regulator [Actinomadura darangshiensis]TDD87193.1 TetR/AcrR family transcriptional regulator [Actinomadura darangshiensis]
MPDVKHFDPDTVLDQVVRLFWRRGAAATGIAEVVAETGISRSSLYTTFGGKRELQVAALRRYVDRQSRPVFDRLAADGRGLPAIAGFFEALVTARCSGEHARWGCMVSNAHAVQSDRDAAEREVLDAHHEALCTAMRAALRAASDHGQLRDGLDADATAQMLALLAYGVNLRSRAGASPAELSATVGAALRTLTAR